MDRTILLIIAALLASITEVHAEFTGTTSLATDYVFRGISNTDEDPAVQGSLDYSHENGLYAGMWASNVKFRENAGVDAVDTVDEASIEIDYYAGFAGESASGVGWDVGAIYYSYPGAEADLNYDYGEACSTLNYSFEAVPLQPEIGVGLYYSPEYFGDSGKATYTSGTLQLSLPEEFGINFTAGKQWFDEALDYMDWKLGVTKALAGFDFEIAYTDTDLSKSDCGGESICAGRAIFSVSRTLK